MCELCIMSLSHVFSLPPAPSIPARACAEVCIMYWPNVLFLDLYQYYTQLNNWIFQSLLS